MRRILLPLFALAIAIPAHAQTVEQRIAAYKHRVGLLEAQNAVEDLQATYGYYFDKGLWDQAAALFAPNGSFEYGQRGVYIGRAHIQRAMLLFGPQGLAAGHLNNHMMLQAVITIADDGLSAKARWQGMVMLAQPGQNGMWGVGVYENEYVRQNGVWKIAKLHFYVTAETDYDAGWTKSAIPMEGPSALLPPDKPASEVYRAFPGVYIPPFDYKHPVTGKSLVGIPQPADDVVGEEVMRRLLLVLALVATPALADTPEQRLDALDKRITRLEDMNQVEKVQRAYGYFVDKGQWTQLSELFADDATLEIGGKGLFLGKKRVLEYMQTAFGPDGPKEGVLANHMQFQPIVDISPDGKTAWVRSRAFVMSVGGWGLPLYEDEFTKENGVWKFSRESGPFTMYSSWKGWGHDALNNTWPDKFDPPPDLPPSTVYLTYPAYWIVPFHYPNPVTGKPFPVEPVGAYQAPPGTPEQEASLKVGRLADGTQPIAQPPKD